MCIDGIKGNFNDKEYSIPHDLIDFVSDFNRNTGEISDKEKGKYYNLNIEKFPSGRVCLIGSLHKFFNRTDYNGNDFSINNLKKTIQSLEKELNINADNFRLENIEIGVNIELNFFINNFLQHLLFHRSETFCKRPKMFFLNLLKMNMRSKFIAK